MSITLTHPGKGRKVTVPDAVAESYISQGWVVPGSPAPAEPDSATTETKAEEPSKKWNKGQLTAYAGEHGIDLTDAKTKDDILALIAAAALTAEDADESDEEDEDADADNGEADAVPADAVDGADS